MEMENEKKFKTKTGFCHIFPDKIVLTRDGIVGNVAKITIGNSITRILTIYGLISLGLIYVAYKYWLEGQAVLAAIFGIICLYLIYGIVTT